jgi:putative tricarboxylic transport membrane protein
MSASAAPETETGLSRKAVELVVALTLMGLAGLVLWDSYDRGAGWDGGPQNGFFPARVGWLLLLSSAFVLVSAVRAADSVFVTWGQLRQVARVLVPLILFIFGIAYLGIYLASALFMVLFMVTLGRFRWWATLAAAVLVPAITFWVFEVQFRVPLPKGPLEAAFGY